MKKIFISLFLIIFITINLLAQQQGRYRTGLDIGLAFPNHGAGIDFGLDIRYNILNNLNLGIKFGTAGIIKDIQLFSGQEKATAMAIGSLLLISDYYFNKGDSHLAPFLGGGFGIFRISNMRFNSEDSDNNNMTFNIDSKAGAVVRGGFEIAKFRIALEYYIIPRSRLYNLDGYKIGHSNNCFANLTIGFYLGGGKWKKRESIRY